MFSLPSEGIDINLEALAGRGKQARHEAGNMAEVKEGPGSPSLCT